MASSRISRIVGVWNKKLHIYFGLFSLLFLWLFAVSGLIMNHPQMFSGKPIRTKSERPVQLPAEVDGTVRAKALREQLGITGEIIVPKVQRTQGHFTFMAVKPNHRTAVNVDLESQIAIVTEITLNRWAVLGELHTFTGMRGMWNESNPERDWFMSQLWSFTMDAVSVGLIFLVISSLYMWYILKQNQLWGLVAFGIGMFSCAFFLWGLIWMP